MTLSKRQTRMRERAAPVSGNCCPRDNINVEFHEQEVASDGMSLSGHRQRRCLLRRRAERESRQCWEKWFMWKVGGAKAALGGGLDEVIAAAQKAVDNTRSIGIGLTPCAVPAVGKPISQLKPEKMEIGIGHHGEPGIRVDTLRPAAEMARMMLDVILRICYSRQVTGLSLRCRVSAPPPSWNCTSSLQEGFEATLPRVASTPQAVRGELLTSLEMMGVTSDETG